MDVPNWPHEFAITVDLKTARDVGIFQRTTSTLAANLNEWDVALKVEPDDAAISLRIGPLDPKSGKPTNNWPDEQRWTGMELVACFEDLAVGTELSPRWFERKGLLTALRVPGGVLSTVATRGLTETCVFRWKGHKRSKLPPHCEDRVQPSTKIVRLASVDLTKAMLVFTSRATGDVRTVELFDGAEIVLTSTPLGGEPANTADGYRLDLQHALATMQLCDVEPGKDVELRLNLSGSQEARPGEAAELAADDVVRLLGRPNCGPRWLFDYEGPIS
jgi:hypothetical protein